MTLEPGAAGFSLKTNLITRLKSWIDGPVPRRHPISDLWSGRWEPSGAKFAISFGNVVVCLQRGCGGEGGIKTIVYERSPTFTSVQIEPSNQQLTPYAFKP